MEDDAKQQCCIVEVRSSKTEECLELFRQKIVASADRFRLWAGWNGIYWLADRYTLR